MLDNMYIDLRDRFTQEVLDALILPILLPESIVNMKESVSAPLKTQRIDLRE